MAEFRFTETAAADLDDIVTYTAGRFGRHQALRYGDELLRSAQFVADFPALGVRYTTRTGSTFSRYNSGQHALFYQLTDSGILIVRILHLMMDFDRHLG